MEKAIRRAKKEGKIAKTAQQTIPYEEMYPDGICRITNRLYSKSVLCDDINYAEASDDEKAVLFELYCKLVNYFGPSVGFELSVICYPADLVEYRKMLALNPQGDQFDEIRKEYSDMLVRQVSKSRYERRICLTYTIEADGIRQARSRLEQIDNDVVGHFRALTVAAHPMDGYERLTILHRCLHLEENRKFRFNWDSLNHTGLSSKDYIAPSSFFFKDGRYFRSGASFGAVSFLQIRATKLYDTLLNSILAITILWCSVRVAPALCRGLGELPNKRKGINFCQQPYKGRRAKGYPFPLLAKSFVICSRVPHLATFQKDSAFQKSTFLFRFVRDDTLNMNT